MMNSDVSINLRVCAGWSKAMLYIYTEWWTVAVLIRLRGRAGWSGATLCIYTEWWIALGGGPFISAQLYALLAVVSNQLRRLNTSYVYKAASTLFIQCTKQMWNTTNYILITEYTLEIYMYKVVFTWPTYVRTPYRVWAHLQTHIYSSYQHQCMYHLYKPKLNNLLNIWSHRHYGVSKSRIKMILHTNIIYKL